MTPENNVIIHTDLSDTVDKLPDFARLMFASNTGVILHALHPQEGNQFWINNAGMSILGTTPEETDPNLLTWIDRIHPSESAEYIKRIDELDTLERGNARFTYRLSPRAEAVNAYGQRPYKWLVEDRTRDSINGTQYTLSFLTDVTEIGDNAYKDPLTGLYNRAYLNKFWTHMYLRQKLAKLPIGIAVADMDKFKDINDRLGHLAGDRALITAGNALMEGLREDDIAVRWGGDEFAIIIPFPQKGTTQMRSLTTRLHARLQTAGYNIDGIPLSMSIGFHQAYPHQINESDPAKVLSLMFSRADVAAKEAKESGRNQAIEYVAKKKKS